jgi:hypothetical protein
MWTLKRGREGCIKLACAIRAAVVDDDEFNVAWIVNLEHLLDRQGKGCDLVVYGHENRQLHGGQPTAFSADLKGL